MCRKEVIALYVLQFKMFRWSRELIENRRSNGIDKSSPSRYWVVKVAGVETLMSLGVGKKLTMNRKY